MRIESRWPFLRLLAAMWFAFCETPDDQLEAWVNGRFTYWASTAPIPGGISYENFELFAPFRQGAEYWFGVRRGLPSGIE
jgi:hypothetical protein